MATPSVCANGLLRCPLLRIPGVDGVLRCRWPRSYGGPEKTCSRTVPLQVAAITHAAEKKNAPAAPRERPGRGRWPLELLEGGPKKRICRLLRALGAEHRSG